MQCVVSCTCFLVCAIICAVILGLELSMIPVLMLATTAWFAAVVANVVAIEVLVHCHVCIGRMCVAKAQALSKLFAFTANTGGLPRRHCIYIHRCCTRAIRPAPAIVLFTLILDAAGLCSFQNDALRLASCSIVIASVFVSNMHFSTRSSCEVASALLIWT